MDYLLFWYCENNGRKFYWCGGGHMDERLKHAKLYPTSEAAERSSKHIKMNFGQWRRSSKSLETMQAANSAAEKVKVA